MRTHRLALIVAVLVAACSGPIAPTALPAVPSGSVGSPGSSTAPGAACIDRADLADIADVPVSVMASLVADLKAANAARARIDAVTAAGSFRQLADFVNAAQPQAASKFRAAASELDAAAPQFPGGQAMVDQAQADLSTGLTLARGVVCST